MSTIRLTVGQAIVRFMASQYIERDGVEQRFIAGVWGIFGHGNVAGLGQALEELGDEYAMPYYRPQNEQGQVHIASAFAKHNNRMRAFACTSSIGPGATNMITGAATATVNRLPVLLFPSDYFANRLVDPVLQQVEHPIEHDVSASDAFRPVSRYFDRISRPEQLISSLPEAFRVLTDPAETGAVTISLPEDVQAEVYDWPERFFEKRVWRVRRPRPEAELVAEVVELIKGAKRPLIVAGGGAIYAGAEAALDALATRYGIPVSESQAGKGVLPWNHPWNMGPIGSAGGLAANRLAKDADLVIGVGTRMGDFVTASRSAFQDPDVTFVGININAFDAHKMRSLPLIGDAREALKAISAGLAAAGYDGTSQEFRSKAAALKNEWDERVTAHRTISGEPGDLSQPEVIGVVNDAIGGHATIICAAGSLPGDLLKLWRPEDPKAYHLEYGYSCMGYEIAGGLGIKMADPKRDVYVMVGDGSYLMMNNEIITSIQEGLKLTIVLMDNSGFNSIGGLSRSLGQQGFGTRYVYPKDNKQLGDDAGASAVDLPVDLAMNARGLGAHVIECKTYEDFVAALEAEKSIPKTTVIYIRNDRYAGVGGYESWWDVPPAQVSEMFEVRQAREKWAVGRAKERLFL